MNRREALATAERLVPALAARAAECEALRRCPDSTIDEFNASGLMRIMQPARWGGDELGLDVLIEVTRVLCRGCASSAWVWMNLASHSWMIGQFELAAQADVWSEDRHAVAATGLAFPCGRARRVEGGFRVSGRWPFASGVDSARWMIVGAAVDGVAERRFFLVPRADFRSLDDWRAYGLAGTGSHDVAVDDCFVPDHRSLEAERYASGFECPGAAVNPAPLYRTPPFPAFGFALASLPLGAAQAAFEGFVAAARARSATYTGVRLAELGSIQARIAEAGACLDFAATVLHADVEAFLAAVARGESPAVETRVRWKRNVAFGSTLAVRAVDTLMAAAGAGGLGAAAPLQRHFRDAHAAAAHIALTWDVQAAAYGQNALGIPLPSGVLL